MRRLHNVVRTGTVLRYLFRTKVAQARPRHVMSLSNGAAQVFVMPRFHNGMRTGTVLRYHKVKR